MNKINVLFIIYICLTRIYIVLSAQKSKIDSNQCSAYFWYSKDLFDNLPDIDNEIIFLENSIIDGCEGSELYIQSVLPVNPFYSKFKKRIFSWRIAS